MTTPLDELTEAMARAILIADGVKYVLVDAEWQADVRRYREMCAKHTDYESGRSMITDAFRRARVALAVAMKAAIEACVDVQTGLLSPKYATGQPMSSLSERFACGLCIDALRALAPPETK